MKSSIEGIHDDIKIIKEDIKAIKEYLEIGVKLKEEIKREIEEARERIKKGEYVSHEDLLKEFKE